jgi:hypothetical protein
MFGKNPPNLKKDENIEDELIQIYEQGITINNYLSEIKDKINNYIKFFKRILLNADPATGKTAFFAELCTEHKKSNTEGRIIFCSPFIIIQEQFKARLRQNDVVVDFELNHKAKRKSLIDSDRIITSTFHSIYHIADQLNENDLIIVDEAHSLMFSYKSNNKRTFFSEIYKVLYNTTAKIVLMSGTPYPGIIKFLNLRELKVYKTNIKSVVNIQYSNERQENVVLEFARNCLLRYGGNSLNTIYIKSKSKCHKFKDLLQSQLKVKALVLTSEEKDTIAYKKLIKDSTISSDIQFLVTTNVISTGANILNDNVGQALMLDEFNPVEIKQFSKRFRNKLDINIDVINPVYKEYENPREERDELVEKRDYQLTHIKEVIEYLETKRQSTYPHMCFDNKFYDYYEGSFEHLRDNLIERHLIQEVYYSQKINQTFNSPIELENALNNFNDVISVETDLYSNSSTPLEIDEVALQAENEFNLNRIIDHFILNDTKYLVAIYHYLNAKDRYNKFIFDKVFEYNAYETQIPDKSILEIVCNSRFKHDIILPLFEIEPIIKDIKKSLYFIKKLKKNKRAPLQISLYFNEQFRKFFMTCIDALDDQKEPELLTKETSFTSNTIHDGLTKKFLRHTYNYLLKNDFINYQDFNDYLVNKKITISKEIGSFLSFPYDNMKIEKPSGKVISYNRSFIIGLVRSIFLLNPKQEYRSSKNGRKASYLYINKDPDFDLIRSKSKTEYKDVKKIMMAPGDLEYQTITLKHDKINLNKSHRKLATKNTLLYYNLLDTEFYSLLDSNNDN